MIRRRLSVALLEGLIWLIEGSLGLPSRGKKMLVSYRKRGAQWGKSVLRALGAFLWRYLKELSPWKIVVVVETRFFLFYFFWEILNWRRFRKAIFFWGYLILLALLWGCFWTWLFLWYDGLMLCLGLYGPASAGFLFVGFWVVGGVFSDLRRLLRDFLIAYVIEDRLGVDWRYEEAPYVT